MVTAPETDSETLQALPGDAVRELMWRYADRYEAQMLVQATRAVARGPVARLVAEGGRNHHEWTPEKAALLKEYDESGITGVFMEPEEGGYISGPKNLILALIAFELAWVDAGAATASLANCLALSPIHERGTPEQRSRYMQLAAPDPSGEREPWRGAFCLTEPIPYVGVDTGMLNGKASIVEWNEGEEPVLQIEKRGRFITNMGFANFVTAAVDTGDERIRSSFMVILEEGDPGSWDRGSATKKMVHQLSSTTDPIFSLRVPASRIIGGYQIRDGLLVPNFNHSQIIEAVFKRTRVTVAAMTSAKLLSAVEPVIRYHRERFRGAQRVSEGTVRYELGLQQRQDSLHRLLDVWAMGEAGASLAFGAARVFDELDPIEREKFRILAERGIEGPKAEMKLFRGITKDALELIELSSTPAGRDDPRCRELAEDTLIRYAILDSVAGVLCPAAKLWNTGQGANAMREAVSLMGGYGITEDCPGFLPQKWMDAQLESTYEGPEAVQRRQLGVTMTNPLFIAQLRQWIAEMRDIGARRPGTGACTLATGMALWLWSFEHLRGSKDALGGRLYQDTRQGVTFPLADALSWLLASRQQILDVLELEERGPDHPVAAEGLGGTVSFLTDLCHLQAARSSGEAARICAELVFGYNRHPAWGEGTSADCPVADDASVLDEVVAGLRDRTTERDDGTVVPSKAGPCAGCAAQLETFQRLRAKLDTCLTGTRLARDRAAGALAHVMIPAALDYPA